MAGDWIKMRSELWDHPKVVRILSAMCPQNVRDLSARCRVIGALYRTWTLADAYTEDGILDGYDEESLDTAIGIQGWAANMQHVGWLIIEPQRLIVPRFTEHNGESAKRRAEDAARKKRVRKTSAKRPQTNGQNADQIREKRREDSNSGITTITKRPTLDEVRAYCAERHNGIDPQAFIDFYTANGWKVGRNPMKDWRACVRTWERNQFSKGSRNGQSRINPGNTHDPGAAERDPDHGRM